MGILSFEPCLQPDCDFFLPAMIFLIKMIEDEAREARGAFCNSSSWEGRMDCPPEVIPWEFLILYSLLWSS
jgi:hypothetical protein